MTDEWVAEYNGHRPHQANTNLLCNIGFSIGIKLPKWLQIKAANHQAALETISVVQSYPWQVAPHQILRPFQTGKVKFKTKKLHLQPFKIPSHLPSSLPMARLFIFFFSSFSFYFHILANIGQVNK